MRNNTIATEKSQSISAESPKVRVKPHEEAFVKFLQSVESTGSVPDDVSPSEYGDLAMIVDTLIEALQNGGLDGYLKAKKPLLKTKRLAYISSTYAPAPDIPPPDEPLEDMRLTRYADGKIGFKTYKMSDIRKMPRVPWLISSVIQLRATSLLVGDSNTGKTFIALHMAECVARGMDWIGHTVTGKHHVLYVYGEGMTNLGDRIDAWNKQYTMDDTNLIDFVPFPAQLITERDEICITVDHLDAIPSLIIFDTLSVCAAGIEENNNTEMAKAIATASYIRSKYGCHVMIVHHGSDKPRGASALRGNVDTVLLVTEETPGSLKIYGNKQRDRDKKAIYVRREIIDLGLDPDTLESLSSCVIVADTEASDNWKEKAEDEQKLMLELLANNPGSSQAQWRNLCKPVGINRSSFDSREKYMVNQKIITRHEWRDKTGSKVIKVTYTINPAQVPAQDVQETEQ